MIKVYETVHYCVRFTQQEPAVLPPPDETPFLYASAQKSVRFRTTEQRRNSRKPFAVKAYGYWHYC